MFGIVARRSKLNDRKNPRACDSTINTRKFLQVAQCNRLANLTLALLTITSTFSATTATPSGQSPHLHTLTACDRSTPLGMISGDISDWQLSSSSTRPAIEADRSFSCHERYARLYQPNGWSWCSKYKTSSEWLQIDLGVIAKVTGVLIQGRGDGQEWVTAFLISYSLDAFTWKYAGDTYGNKRIFDGNVDSYSIKAAYLSESLMARFVRIHTFSWHEHPSMRVEIIGCQPCKSVITLPTSAKMSASSELPTMGGSSCRADDGLLMTGKAWCAEHNDATQWLQFDIGPPSVVTGVVTMGRGDSDSDQQQWVTRYRLAYSNDSVLWKYYSDASHLEAKEFGGNMNADLERWHFVNSPFVARYIRLYPLEWSTHVSLRAGLIGCRHKGKCDGEFARINVYAPCVENLSYQKPIWINSYRPTHKKRRHTSYATWRRASSRSTGNSNRQADGRIDDIKSDLTSKCVTLNNAYVDRPTMRVDIGRRHPITGVVITVMKSTTRQAEPPSTIATNVTSSRKTSRDVTPEDVDRLDVYVTNDVLPADSLTKSSRCGISFSDVTKNDREQVVKSSNKSVVNIQCLGQGGTRPEGRHLYIQAIGPTRRTLETGTVRNGKRPHFEVVICDVTVY